MRRFEEAWWCCLHHAGIAMVRYAQHAVTLHGDTISVNLLVPGLYRLTLPGRHETQVRITSGYPASAEATIDAENLPREFSIRLRVPTCIKHRSSPNLVTASG